MKNWLEKQFRLSEFNTDIKTELLAGLTTFVTMAYVLATIPNILAGAGYDKHTTLTVMILLIIVTSCAMALFTNRPFALAPGLGSVGIIASMITNEGVSMPIAAGVIFWSGVLFIIISFFGLREAVVRVIPVSLKQSVSAGIGLFIALLGAKNCGLIVANDAKNCLSFGDLASPSVIVAVIGFVILLVIKVRNIPGGMILTILLTTLAGIPFGVTHAPESIFALPAGIGHQFLKVDFLGALDFAYIPFLIALFVPDFFSTFGTVLGVGAKAGYLDKDGNLPGIDKCFKVDAVATSFERDIEQALVRDVTKLLLELGTGFAFLGNQYHLNIGGDDFYIDLLFYNLNLRCYVVIELKTGDFKPEYAGQLNFYLSAVDGILKKEQDNPSIGLLLCKSKNNVVAEYSLKDISKPIGVSEYKITSSLPDDLEKQLPSVEDIQKRIK